MIASFAVDAVVRFWAQQWLTNLSAIVHGAATILAALLLIAKASGEAPNPVLRAYEHARRTADSGIKTVRHAADLFAGRPVVAFLAAGLLVFKPLMNWPASAAWRPPVDASWWAEPLGIIITAMIWLADSLRGREYRGKAIVAVMLLVLVVCLAVKLA